MKEDNKYYTPDLEDLCIGYECEILNTADAQLRWYKETVDKAMLPIVVRISDKGIRTKYLDREDIESLGWVEFNNSRGEMDQPWYLSYRHKDNNKLILNHTGHINDPDPAYQKVSDTIAIYEDHNKPNEAWSHNQQWKYRGKCKSKNELKTLVKWLWITVKPKE